ncbi:MAG: DUF1501 domain-containing protein [Isosphaeraceae bacterium]
MIVGGAARDCDGVRRRSFLQAGMLGQGGLALADLLRLRAAGETAAEGRGRSVILFWLSGGPGHMETWDPKPDAPGGFRGPFGAVPTSVPGVHFGELLPEQARRTEDPRLRDRYGRHTFGQSALLARRLVEAGTPFVTVNCVPWDHHGTKPQLPTEVGARKLIRRSTWQSAH